MGGKKKNRRAPVGSGEGGAVSATSTSIGVNRPAAKSGMASTAVSGLDSGVPRAAGLAANALPSETRVSSTGSGLPSAPSAQSSSYSQALKGTGSATEANGTAVATNPNGAHASKGSRRLSGVRSSDAGNFQNGNSVSAGGSHPRVLHQQLSGASNAAPSHKLSANAPVFTSTLECTPLIQAYPPGVPWSGGSLQQLQHLVGQPVTNGMVGPSYPFSGSQNGASVARAGNGGQLPTSGEVLRSSAAKEAIVKQSKLSAFAPEFKSSQSLNQSLSTVQQRGFVVRVPSRNSSEEAGNNSADAVQLDGTTDASDNSRMASEAAGGILPVEADFSESSSTSSTMEGFRDSISSASDQSSCAVTGSSSDVGQNRILSKKWSPVASESGSTTPPLVGEETANQETAKTDGSVEVSASRVGQSGSEVEGDTALEVEHLRKLLALEKARAESALEELENLRQTIVVKGIESDSLQDENCTVVNSFEQPSEEEKMSLVEARKEDQQQIETLQAKLLQQADELEELRKRMNESATGETGTETKVKLARMEAELAEVQKQRETLAEALRQEGEKADSAEKGFREAAEKHQMEIKALQQELSGKEGELKRMQAQTVVPHLEEAESIRLDGKGIVEEGKLRGLEERLELLTKALEEAAQKSQLTEAAAQKAQGAHERERDELQRKVLETTKENVLLRGLVEKHKREAMDAVQKFREEVTAERDALLAELDAKLTAQHKQSVQLKAEVVEAVAKAKQLAGENEELNRQLAGRTWSSWLMPSVVGAGVGGGVIVAFGVCRRSGSF